MLYFVSMKQFNIIQIAQSQEQQVTGFIRVPLNCGKKDIS